MYFIVLTNLSLALCFFYAHTTLSIVYITNYVVKFVGPIICADSYIDLFEH